MNRDKLKCKNKSLLITQEMDNFGFTINETESVLISTQRLEFVGVIIDTVLFKVFLTEAKINKILSLCAQIISSKTNTTRKLSSFIGLCVHAFNAITLAPLHYRSLERDKIKNLAVYNGDYDSPIALSQESTTEVIWWSENVEKLNGKFIRKTPIDFFI